jgi:hypothetical protein
LRLYGLVFNTGKKEMTASPATQMDIQIKYPPVPCSRPCREGTAGLSGRILPSGDNVPTTGQAAFPHCPAGGSSLPLDRLSVPPRTYPHLPLKGSLIDVFA